MRIMEIGDKITGGTSAYSKLGEEICSRLAEAGHSVAHTPIGRVNRMGKQVYHNVLIYPSGEDYFAEDVALANYTDFKANLLIAVKDTWIWNHIHKLGINFCPFAVVDHSPVSQSLTYRLETAFKPIAISRFGQIELNRKKISSVYIPHGVRCDLYKPLSQEQKVEARRLFGLPKDAFVVGIVAMNRARKMIDRMLRGFKRFRELNPDINAHLMLWSNVAPRKPVEDITLGVSDVGVNLIPEIIDLGINEFVHWPKWSDVEQIGGLPEYDPSGNWDMAKLYGTFDVNLLCSGGEGAGLPYLEAGSCGVPSIGTNYAGAPEHIGPGLTVSWHDYIIFNTPGVRYVLPDIDGMAEAMRKIYDSDREKLGRKCRKFAESYDWKVVMSNYWTPFLRECSDELYPLITKEGAKSWA
jgi:glycosyltransferase involved in cell wall biosynthesis